MDAKVVNILKDKVASEWKIFAFCTGFNDVAAVVDQIDHDVDIDLKGQDDLIKEKSKIEYFLKKLYEQHPNDYRTCIQNSLKVMRKNDVLHDIDFLESEEEEESSNVNFLLNQELTESSDLAESKKEEESSVVDFLLDQEQTESYVPDAKRIKIDAEQYKHGEPLVAQVDLESSKSAVSICIDLNLSQSAPSSFSNEGPPRIAALNDYSAADENEEKVNVVKDQPKMSDILDNSELLLQLAIMVGEDWQILGRFLSIKDHELDVIDLEYNGLKEKAHRMLSTWKNQQKFPALDALAKAIYKINRLDLIRVMEKFSNKSFERENPLKPSIEEKENISKALKTHYLKIYKTTEQLVHKMITPIDVELSDKFIELTLVNANEVERDAVNNSERKYFLQKHLSYERIGLQEVLSENPSLLLISGIAGIGKTWYLKKCLLDWAKGLIWKNVDLVFFLECRQLNLFDNIGSVDELLNFFYKDVLEGFNISPYLSMLFVVDGLDEFFWLNELLKHDSKNLSQYPIVNALADALNFDKAKCVIAGRVGAISKYKCTVQNKKDKLIIQIMGFNNDGINDYIEKNTNKNQIESVNNVLQESYAAKAMASVPFYLAVMCAIITSTSEKYYSFNTMTELYCCIFLYFLQKHINKNEEPIWKMMESASVKETIYRICKIAFELLNQGKVIFTDSEMKHMGNFDNHDNDKVFGFIEKIDSHTGYRYQFVHLTLMEFCASVHAYICLTPSEIMRDKRIRSLVPMICGLANRDSSCFINFIAKMKKSREESYSLLQKVLNLVPKGIDRRTVSEDLYYNRYDEYKIFIECFFEAHASIKEDMKRLIDEREWRIWICNGKSVHEVSHEKYFMEKFFDAGCKLNKLIADKKILSEDEKKLVILCSTNVRRVWLDYPVKIDEWTPKHKLESLWINIKLTFVPKNEFEGFVLPWIRLAENLHLDLHDDTNFIDDICEWLRGSNFKKLWIEYRGKYFNNIEEFKKREKFLLC